MKNPLQDNRRLKEASQYITAAALCVMILYSYLKLWRADLRVPFYYAADSLFYLMFAKGIVDNGWYWQNPFLGAPGQLEMYDFPTFDNAVTAIFWLLSLFTHNAALIINLFYLLSFPLVTLTSLYVLRKFNFSFATALFCSLLYTFLPFHFLRNQSHLVLSAYYVIPFAVLVLLWITTEEIFPRTRKFLISVVICVLLGSSGIYYPFFFCYLLLVAGAIGAQKLRRFRPLATALIFAALTTATVAVNLSPSLVHRYRYGNPGVMVREPEEAQRHGLRISQLVLPITHHRIPLLDRLKGYYNQFNPMTDSETASLGIVGTIGFLLLLVQLLHRKEIIPGARGLLHDLSMLNIFTLLLAVVGGFGYLVALLVSSGIRSYNRISVFISFFALMAVAFALDRIYQRNATRRVVFYALLTVVFIAGFLDETTSYYVQDYAKTKAEYSGDEEFVNRIEASVPPGAMIFQLPYVAFLEQPGMGRMRDYDHFRGYIHSKSLHWSYGSVKNREGDRAQQMVAALPAQQFVQALAFAGFDGIYLDRFGYDDNGAAKEQELSQILQSKPFTSTNGRLVFFNLGDYAKSLREKYSDAEREKQKQLSFRPLLLDWEGGFAELESRPGKSWRWCSAEGDLRMRNLAPFPRTVRLEMSFATGYPVADDLFITGLVSDQLKVSSTPTPYSKTVTLPPGDSVIHFRSTARRVDAPLDTRILVFRVEDFKMTESE